MAADVKAESLVDLGARNAANVGGIGLPDLHIQARLAQQVGRREPGRSRSDDANAQVWSWQGWRGPWDGWRRGFRERSADGLRG